MRLGSYDPERKCLILKWKIPEFPRLKNHKCQIQAQDNADLQFWYQRRYTLWIRSFRTNISEMLMLDIHLQRPIPLPGQWISYHDVSSHTALLVKWFLTTKRYQCWNNHCICPSWKCMTHLCSKLKDIQGNVIRVLTEL